MDGMLYLIKEELDDIPIIDGNENISDDESSDEVEEFIRNATTINKSLEPGVLLEQPIVDILSEIQGLQQIDIDNTLT